MCIRDSTYIEEEQILVTCDSFGSHYGFDDVLLSKVTDWEGYMRATKYYYDNIIGPFKPFMLKALERVRELDISMICTGHGPVIDDKIDFILNTYEEWSTVVNPNPKKTVIMPYVSAYGYTKSLAEKMCIRDRKENAEEKLKNDKDNKELISNISHDLKTPITAIKGYVEGIMDGVADTPEKMDRYIKTIYNKANEMNTLINELTFYTKIDTNRIPYNFAPVRVNDYFNDCAENLSSELTNQGVEFEMCIRDSKYLDQYYGK